MKSITEAALAKFQKYRSVKADLMLIRIRLRNNKLDLVDEMIDGLKIEMMEFFNYELGEEQFETDFETAIGSKVEAAIERMINSEPVEPLARPTKRKRTKKVAAPKPRVRAKLKRSIRTKPAATEPEPEATDPPANIRFNDFF